MLLSVSNLTVNYGAIAALQGVCLEINQGEIVALIGANGAGKTTLLRTISGLLRPTQGGIAWCPPAQEAQSGGALNYFAPSCELVGMRPDQIVRLGISHVPEGRQIFADLSVHDNLLLGAYQNRSHRQIHEGLERAFALFPVLAQRKNQRAGTLSGGEQQMLAIGRALMARPRLLLLDEPSLGLAPIIVQQIFRIITDLHRDGATIFLVEQNAHMALSIAHRGYVLQSGCVILTDTAASLLDNPQVKAAYLGG